MFRCLANRVIQWIISPRIEQMPDEARRRYFRNVAWFCFVLALSEALFAFLIFWAWLTIVWVASVLPAIWLAIGAVLLFFVAAVTFTAARIAGERAKNTR
jgi:predicted permease